MKPVYYSQHDSRWGKYPYSNPDESTTISESGCGTTCMAMVLATWVDKNITPLETSKWALEHGYKATNQGTYYGYFVPQAKEYGLVARQLNYLDLRYSGATYKKLVEDIALNAIKDGDYVIACMGKGKWTGTGHFVLWYGIDGTDVLLNDSNSTREDLNKADITEFRSQVKFYWVIERNHSYEYFKVKEKYGFEPKTMLYLEQYDFADYLFKRMLLPKDEQHYQLNTINYILNYEFGREVFSKLYNREVD